MLIRTASDDDLDLVATLRLAFLAEQRGVSVDELDPGLVAATPPFVIEHQRTGDLVTWLAVDGDETVGLVSMLIRTVPPRPRALATREGYVLNLYVAPSRRRTGVGQRLLDACLHHARSNAFGQLVLHTTDDGRRLYEVAGFVRSDRWYELHLG